MSGCCKSLCYRIADFNNDLCENWIMGAAITAGSAATSAACAASAALVGITAAPAVLYGATAGVVFYVTFTAMEQITGNEQLQLVVAVALAVIAGIFVTAAVLGVKVSIATALIMSAATAGAIAGGVTLLTAVQNIYKDCCKEKAVYDTFSRHDGEAGSVSDDEAGSASTARDAV